MPAIRNALLIVSALLLVFWFAAPIRVRVLQKSRCLETGRVSLVFAPDSVLAKAHFAYVNSDSAEANGPNFDVLRNSLPLGTWFYAYEDGVDIQVTERKELTEGRAIQKSHPELYSEVIASPTINAPYSGSFEQLVCHKISDSSEYISIYLQIILWSIIDSNWLPAAREYEAQ